MTVTGDDALNAGDAVFLGFMGQHRTWDHITDGEDPWNPSGKVSVDLDKAATVGGDPDLVEPTVRSYVERQLDLIAAGTREIGTVVTHVLTQFLAKFRYFVANIGAMDALFDASMGGGSGGRRIPNGVYSVLCELLFADGDGAQQDKVEAALAVRLRHGH